MIKIVLIICTLVLSQQYQVNYHNGPVQVNDQICVRSNSLWTVSQKTNVPNAVATQFVISPPSGYNQDLYLNFAFQNPVSQPVIVSLTAMIKSQNTNQFGTLMVSNNQAKIPASQLTGVTYIGATVIVYDQTQAVDFTYQVKVTQAASPITYNSAIAMSSVNLQIADKQGNMIKGDFVSGSFNQVVTQPLSSYFDLDFTKPKQKIGGVITLAGKQPNKKVYAQFNLKSADDKFIYDFQACSTTSLWNCNQITFANPPQVGQTNFVGEIPASALTNKDYIIFTAALDYTTQSKSNTYEVKIMHKNAHKAEFLTAMSIIILFIVLNL